MTSQDQTVLGWAEAKHRGQQYTLGKIAAIWALAAVPMPVLAFVVAPALTSSSEANPTLIAWYLMIAGMIWQFILSLILLHQECGLQNWDAMKARIWLQTPVDPATMAPNARLFLWLIPAFLCYLAAEASGIGVIMGELILIPFPFLEDLPTLDLQDLASGDMHGAWWLVGVALVSCLFNYVLGEELLFRGILLPKCAESSGVGIGWRIPFCLLSTICTGRRRCWGSFWAVWHGPCRRAGFAASGSRSYFMAWKGCSLSSSPLRL